MDVRSTRGADLGLADHYLVRAKIRVKLKKQPSSSIAKIFDSQRLGCEQVTATFRAEVERRFGETEIAGVDYNWERLKVAVNESAANVLGFRKTRKEEWISSETWNLIQEKKILKMKMETSNDQTRVMFKNLHRTKAAEVKRASRRDKRRFFHSKADEAEQEARGNDQRKLFKLAKELGGTKN